MTFDDFTNTLRSKFNSPIFFPLVFAFVAINWRALFLLFELEEKVEIRIAAFDDRTDFCSLILWPFILSALITVSTPYIRSVLEWLTRPARRQKRLADDKENYTIEKKRLAGEIENAGLKAKLAVALQRVDRTLSTFETEEGRREAAATIASPDKDDTTPSQANTKRKSGVGWLHRVGKHELLAAYEARKLNKPVLTIAFDSAAPENGGLEYAANNFFKFIDTRTLVEEHFVVRLVDLKNEKLSDNLIGTLSTEEPIYTLQAINGNILDTGRLYQNPDEGLKIVRKLTALIGF